jgi:hypothetical protein
MEHEFRVGEEALGRAAQPDAPRAGDRPDPGQGLQPPDPVMDLHGGEGVHAEDPRERGAEPVRQVAAIARG